LAGKMTTSLTVAETPRNTVNGAAASVANQSRNSLPRNIPVAEANRNAMMQVQRAPPRKPQPSRPPRSDILSSLEMARASKSSSITTRLLRPFSKRFWKMAGTRADVERRGAEMLRQLTGEEKKGGEWDRESYEEDLCFSELLSHTRLFNFKPGRRAGRTPHYEKRRSTWQASPLMQHSGMPEVYSSEWATALSENLRTMSGIICFRSQV